MLIAGINVRQPILLIASLAGFLLCGLSVAFGQDNSTSGQTSPRNPVQQGNDNGAANPITEQGVFMPTVIGAPGDLIGAGTRGLAGKRVALVIGNSQYETVTALDNPRNDAKAIAGVLRGIGFDEVKLVEDLDYSEMRRTLKEFAADARGSDVALIYYAGHGVEVGGTNYLVPTDAELPSNQDVDFEAVPLDNVRTAVSGAAKLRLVILDACRNNPFKLASSDGKRSVGRGLARVESDANELIAYAARKGTLASDGTGKGNSPFATALIRHLQTPGLEINFLFRKVRDDVLSATGNEQEPYVYGSLGGEAIYLHLPKGGGSEVSAISPSPPSSDREAIYWSSIEDSKNPAAFKAYLKRYPEGEFAELAEMQLAALEPDIGPTVTPELPNGGGREVADQPVDTPPPSEPDVEIVFWRSVEDSNDPAGFKAYLTQYPQGEFAQLAEIRLAALGPDPAPATEEHTEEPTPEMLRAVQTELSRLGCYSGTIDGDWGRRSQAALDEFARRTSQEAALNAQVMELLKAQDTRVCPEAKAKPKTASPSQPKPKPTTASPSQPKPKATTASRSPSQATTSTTTQKKATTTQKRRIGDQCRFCQR